MPARGRKPPRSFLANPEGDSELGSNVVARYDFPPAEARRGAPPRHLHPELRAALEEEWAEPSFTAISSRV